MDENLLEGMVLKVKKEEKHTYRYLQIKILRILNTFFFKNSESNNDFQVKMIKYLNKKIILLSFDNIFRLKSFKLKNN